MTKRAKLRFRWLQVVEQGQRMALEKGDCTEVDGQVKIFKGFDGNEKENNNCKKCDNG